MQRLADLVAGYFVQAVIAIPPAFSDSARTVEGRIHDTEGRVVATVPATIEPFRPEGKGFTRAVARWSIDTSAPNAYCATGRVADTSGKTLATVAPRLVQEAQMTGR